MKKLFITSAIAILASLPAVAVPTNTSATFPQNGYMLEDYTYTNAATSTNMAGVYENSVNADANYDNCPAGYWCDASGQHACSSLSGGYNSSDAGSTENTACYKSCTVANANIAHATAVSGNDYYGAGTDTCSATSCENGYHTETFDIEAMIGTAGVSGYGYIDISGTGTNAATYGLTENGTFAVEYNSGTGIIKGHARCSYQSGTTSSSDPDSITKLNTLPDSTGTYCWCMVDEYIVDGSSRSLSGPWVFRSDLGSEEDCEGPYVYNCANVCVSALRNTSNFVFRSAVLGSIPAGPATCDANTITINWSGASAADIAANEAGTVTYGGDIRTPRAAEIIPGKVFTGWTFSAPEPDVGEFH